MAVGAYQAGKATRAQRFFKKVIKANPEHVPSLQYMGLLTQQAGLLGQAVAYFRRALSVNSNDPVAWNNLGNLHRESDEPAKAIDCYRAALELEPSYANACFNLGICLRRTNDIKGAIDTFEQLTSLSPEDGEAWVELGACQLLGDLETAADGSFRRAIERQPTPQLWFRIAEAWAHKKNSGNALEAVKHALALGKADPELCFEIGNLCVELGDREGAVPAFQAVLASLPEHPVALQNLASSLVELRQTRAAIEVWQKLVGLQPKNLDAHMGLGLALDLNGQPEKAVHAYEDAIGIAPGHALAYCWLGNACQQIGDFEQAHANFHQALKLDPGLAEAGFGLAYSQRFGLGSGDDLNQLEKLARNPELTERDQTHMQYALGKVYDDNENYAEAFVHYQDANRLQARSVNYDVTENHEWVSRVIECFDEAFFAERADWGHASALPVLIIGMPRSGTSLVEQILASHPTVYGGGEMAVLGEAAKELAGPRGLFEGYHRGVLALDKPATRRLAERYLEAMKKFSGGKAHLIDKLPANFLYAGLAALLVPGLKVIHCRRHPLDVCLSIYFQAFGFGNDYACDLSHIAAYYRDYDRLMKHWHRVLPGGLIEVAYEDLVTSPEPESRRLVSACGLPWDDRCLRYYETRRSVQTASKWQVRQPIYTRAMGRWKNYEGFLDELKNELGELLTT